MRSRLRQLRVTESIPVGTCRAHSPRTWRSIVPCRATGHRCCTVGRGRGRGGGGCRRRCSCLARAVGHRWSGAHHRTGVRTLNGLLIGLCSGLRRCSNTCRGRGPGHCTRRCRLRQGAGRQHGCGCHQRQFRIRTFHKKSPGLIAAGCRIGWAMNAHTAQKKCGAGIGQAKGFMALGCVGTNPCCARYWSCSRVHPCISGTNQLCRISIDPTHDPDVVALAYTTMARRATFASIAS